MFNVSSGYGNIEMYPRACQYAVQTTDGLHSDFMQMEGRTDACSS